MFSRSFSSGQFINLTATYVHDSVNASWKWWETKQLSNYRSAVQVTWNTQMFSSCHEKCILHFVSVWSDDLFVNARSYLIISQCVSLPVFNEIMYTNSSNSLSEFSKWGAYWKSDHKLTITKLKCIWNKYSNNETMKTTITSEIHYTIYRYGSYLALLFGKR